MAASQSSTLSQIFSAGQCVRAHWITPAATAGTSSVHCNHASHRRQREHLGCNMVAGQLLLMHTSCCCSGENLLQRLSVTFLICSRASLAYKICTIHRMHEHSQGTCTGSHRCNLPDPELHLIQSRNPLQQSQLPGTADSSETDLAEYPARLGARQALSW